jgi:hypothetical protein
MKIEWMKFILFLFGLRTRRRVAIKSNLVRMARSESEYEAKKGLKGKLNIVNFFLQISFSGDYAISGFFFIHSLHHTNKPKA